MKRDDSKYLSRRMPLGKGIRGWVIERPSKHLPENDLDALLTDLRTVAANALPGEPLDYGVFDPASGAMDRSIITVIYETKSGRPIAFNSMPVFELNIQNKTLEVIHNGLVIVDPSARSGGLSSLLYGFACALLLIRNQFRPIWVSSVTQVPAIIGLFFEQYSHAAPSFEPDTRPSFRHLQIARQIMCDHRSAFGVGEEAGFDEQRFVITNAYTGGSDNLKKTFDAAPKHRKAIYNDFCETQLDYERGDDVLQIGRLDVAALRHYVFRTLPESSVAGSMLAIVFFGFQYVFLPARHWFDASRAWEGLRPWKE